MKNLHLFRHIWCPIPEVREVEAFCTDTFTDALFVYCQGKVVKFLPNSEEVFPCIDLIEEGHGKPSELKEIIGMHFLSTLQSLCLAMKNGDIFTYHLSSSEVQNVGCIESGIKAMVWSPDEELLTLITGEDHLLLMTEDFNPITEVGLHEEEFGQKQFITVGWGKKETQFHGSEGKTSAKVKSSPIEPALSWDDGVPCISWRGDGKLFAVSTINPNTGARHLRIFDREGVLQCTSEDVNGLEQPVSWKPSGSIIATSQQLPNKHQLAFFEKNGLRHGEFTLPFKPKEVQVKRILWNPESTILGVLCESISNKDQDDIQPFKCCLQLWSVNNYHWYLKKTIDFTKERKLTLVSWDMQKSNRIHIFCEGALYMQYEWKWEVTCSRGTTEKDDTHVSVIDGCKVLLTPFRQVVVPPPISAYELHLPSGVSEIAFAPGTISQKDSSDNSTVVEDSGYIESVDPPGNNPNNLCVILNDQTVVLFIQTPRYEAELGLCPFIKVTGAGGNGFVIKTTCHSALGAYKVEWACEEPPILCDMPQNLHHWLWISKDTLLCLCTTGISTSLCVIEIESIDTENGKLVVRTAIPVDGCVVSLIPVNCSGGTCVALQIDDGRLLKYSLGDEFLSEWCDVDGNPVTMVQPCLKVQICQVEGDFYVFGLTNRHRFYANNQEVANNVTSFALHSEFLLLTTLKHTLLCCLLDKRNIDTLVSRNVEVTKENIRRIERGAQIVSVVQRATTVILQMPRGNLETIHPRPLSLHVISGHLNRGQYYEAFDFMRKQRINLNVIFDHDPQTFLTNIRDFVQKVDNPAWLSLFLSELQETDVTETMYQNYYAQINRTSRSKVESKVDTICEQMKVALESIDSEKYVLPILTSFVKKSNPEISEALKWIKKIKEAEASRKSAVTSDEALKYLLYLVDVNELYDVALGTYDFDLVLMVAAKSQKDPKEYLPFLNDLRKLETNYQHYTIDKYLKNYKSALHSISKAGAEHFEECLTLIRSHNLYSNALKIFDKSSQEYKRICEEYGQNLFSKRYFEEAGLMFKRSGNYSQAVESFRRSGNWRQALMSALLLNYSQNQMEELCNNLVTTLKNAKQFQDASVILDQYLGNKEESISLLVMGRLWEEALLTAHRSNRMDIIESHVKPGVADHHEYIVNHLASTRGTFLRHKARLAIVREEKQRKLLDIDGRDDADNPESDLFSETSSITSSQCSTKVSTQVSGRTYRSSKNRRKQERKKLSLKEGNPYEDIALINALHELIMSTDQLRDEVHSLCKALVEFSKDEEASQLQSLYDDTVSLMEKSKDEIWPCDAVINPSNMEFGPHATANSIAALMQTQSRETSTLSELDVHLRYPPQTSKDTKWKLEILK